MSLRKECFNCRNYTAYYSKGYSCFIKEKFGKCQICHNIVENHNACDKWASKYPVRKRRKVVAITALENAIGDIQIIKQILSEDKDEL